MSTSLSIPFKLIESINDTLTHQSSKAALNLCDKYIKKKPDSVHLQAVRAYLLAQVGRESDAEKLAKTLAQLETKDSLLISTLSKVFGLLGDYEYAATLQLSLFKSQPSLESGFELYETLLKSGELKKAFPVALKLASIADEPSFLSWALTLVYADRCFAISKDSSWANESMLERVAEKVRQNTVDRAVRIKGLLGIEKEDILKRELESRQIEDLRLLVATYLALKERTLAREVLQDLIEIIEAKNASPSDRAIVYRHLIDTEQKEVACGVAKSMLFEFGLHDWTLWRLFTDSIDLTDIECIDQCKFVLAQIEEKSDKRSIILAKLFVYEAEFRQSGKSSENIKTMISEYLTAYSTGCFHGFDIRTLFNGSPAELTNDLSQFCRQKAELSSESRVAWLTCADVLCKDVDLGAKEQHQGDALYDIINLASRGDRASIEQARDKLNKEAGLPADVTPYSYVVVQLIFCLLLGEFSEALGLFKLLEIKAIQLDTLLYLVTDHVFSFGLFDIADAVFEENFQMYNIAQKEKGQYSLAIEYMRFMKRIDNSLQSLSCVSGSIWSKVMNKSLSDIASSIDPLVFNDTILDQTEINKCSDNRDLNILTDIDATGRLLELYEHNFSSFIRPQYYYRVVMSLVLHNLFKSPESPSTETRKHIEVLSSIGLDEVERVIAEFALVSCQIGSSTTEPMPAYTDALETVIKAIDAIVSNQPANDCLPYHFISYCSCLYEHLRVVCLLISAPFSSAAKPRRSAMKSRLQSDLNKVNGLAQTIKRHVHGNSELPAKCQEYVKNIGKLIDSHCIGILP